MSDSTPPAGMDRPGSQLDIGRGLLVAIARWSMRRRWTVLGSWFLLTLVIYVASLFAGVRPQEDADMLSGEAARAERLLDNTDFGDEGVVENVLVQARGPELYEQRAAALMADLTARYGALPRTVDIGEPLPSLDGRSILLQVQLERGSGDARMLPEDVVPGMLEATDAAQQAHPDVRIEQVGAGSLRTALTEGAAEDFRRAELISIPLTFAILLVVFGAVVAAGVPLLLGLTAVFMALGLSAMSSFVLPAHSNQASLILLLGLAVGVDYSLFYLRRVQEERSKGLIDDAVLRITAATSGRAIVVSGLAVVLAMAGMFLAGNAIFSSLALGAITVVGVAVLGSLTALPASLSLLGHRVNRLRIPLLRRQHGEGSRFWVAVLRPVLRAPVAATALGLVFMGLLAWPLTNLQLRMPSDADLPRDYPVVQTLHRVNEAFPSSRASHIVVVEAPTASRGEVHDALARLYEDADATGDFALADGPRIVPSMDGTVMKMPLSTPYGPSSEAAGDSLERIRQELAPATVGQVERAEWAVGGQVAFDRDFSSVQRDRLPLVIGFVVLLGLFVIFVAFRSVRVALVTGALNTISIGAALGLLVLIFQYEWAEGILNFNSTGAIVSWVPLILFVLLFGLSTDYSVFVLSRIWDGRLAGLEYREAIRQGVIKSAGVVSAAAAIMVAVFSVFASLSTIELKQLGLGLALSVMLDATVVRGVLLPGMLAIMGPRRRPAQPSIAASRWPGAPSPH